MALIHCVECGRQISDKAIVCPGCGAPREIQADAPGPQTPDADSSPARIWAATHAGGTALLYDEGTRMFDFGGTTLRPKDVRDLDKLKQLTWTRFDVREVMRKAAKSGRPMGDLPQSQEPSFSERAVMFLEKAGEASAAVAKAAEPKSTAMVCPHCHTKGTVRTKPVTQKKGVSGGKATAAVLTGGLSVLATGLSRKEHLTEAHCTRCGNTWRY